MSSEAGPSQITEGSGRAVERARLAWRCWRWSERGSFLRYGQWTFLWRSITFRSGSQEMRIVQRSKMTDGEKYSPFTSTVLVLSYSSLAGLSALSFTPRIPIGACVVLWSP